MGEGADRGRLYDRFERRSEDASGDIATYRRTRVLRRLWHDERVGDHTRSLDVFPFFTYDREDEPSFSRSWLHTFLR